MTLWKAKALGEALAKTAKPHMTDRDYADLVDAVWKASGVTSDRPYWTFFHYAKAILRAA